MRTRSVVVAQFRGREIGAIFYASDSIAEKKWRYGEAGPVNRFAGRILEAGLEALYQRAVLPGRQV